MNIFVRGGESVGISSKGNQLSERGASAGAL